MVEFFGLILFVLALALIPVALFMAYKIIKEKRKVEVAVAPKTPKILLIEFVLYLTVWLFLLSFFIERGERSPSFLAYMIVIMFLVLVFKIFKLMGAVIKKMMGK